MKTAALTSLRGKIHGIMIRVTAHSCNTCMKMTSTKQSKFKEILPTKAIHRPSICLTMVMPLNPHADGASRGQSYQEYNNGNWLRGTPLSKGEEILCLLWHLFPPQLKFMAERLIAMACVVQLCRKLGVWPRWMIDTWEFYLSTDPLVLRIRVF